MCGPLSKNRSVTCTSCPRRRTFSLPRSAVFVKREAAPHRRPHRAQAGHCAARPPRSRFSRRPRGGGAPRAGSCTMPEGWPGAAAPCAAVPGVPGKALPAPALPEMTPGRPRGAGHPLVALGWPRWGQPPAVCSVCLPRLRGPEITGPLRCGGRRVPQRATLRKGLDPARPRAGGALARPCAGCPVVVTLALRRRTAPRSGARVGTPLAAPRAARHRWAGANCRMTGLRQFAPACLECPLLYAGTFGLRPRAGVGHFDGPRTFQVHLSAAPARGKAHRGVCSTSGRPASTARQVLRTIDTGLPAVLGADNRASGTCAQRPALLRFWRYRHDDFSPCPSRRSASLRGAPAR